ncbi:MAG: 30S ribosomal protein S16 [Patescibacteria group bacterium]|nr:30S ribosomal protein S16 [Patescibacteria group bacterium]
MIRLQRTGRKHEPTFRVVLTDSKNGPKSGKYLETLGWYDSRLENKVDQLDVERIKHWMSKGAKTSVTLHNFLVSKKIIAGKKVNALPRKSPIKKEGEDKPAEAPATAPAAPATSAAPAPAATEAAPAQVSAPTVAPAPAEASKQ